MFYQSNLSLSFMHMHIRFKMMFSCSLSCPSRPAPSLPATVTEYSPSDVRSVMLSELLLSVVL